jgi:hypothetical protein
MTAIHNPLITEGVANPLPDTAFPTGPRGLTRPAKQSSMWSHRHAPTSHCRHHETARSRTRVREPNRHQRNPKAPAAKPPLLGRTTMTMSPTAAVAAGAPCVAASQEVPRLCRRLRALSALDSASLTEHPPQSFRTDSSPRLYRRSGTTIKLALLYGARTTYGGQPAADDERGSR